MKSNSNFRQKVKTINAQKWDIYSVEKFSSEKISSLSSSYYSNIPKTPNFTANLTDQNELFNTVVENKYIRRWTLDQIVEIQIRINFKSNRYRKRFYVQNINMSSLVSKYCKLILKLQNGKFLPIYFKLMTAEILMSIMYIVCVVNMYQFYQVN